MAGAEKISVYNLADLKNTSDDAIPNYLNSLKFKQSHTLIDTRLALGYSAFLLAAACFYWDYKLGFESTKYLTAAAVAVYSALNGALTLWIWLREKGTVYEGTSPTGDKVAIATSTSKNEPIYHVTISTTTNKSAKSQTFKVSRPFNEWFDERGTFVARPFQELLATAVPLIGQQDPKRAVSDSHKLAESSPDMLDALMRDSEVDTAATATAVETSAAGTGCKKRKA